MAFVVDASVAAAWLLPDERPPEALRAYARLSTEYAIVPSLWWFEMRNLLLANERRGRLNSRKTTEALTLLAELPIRLDYSTEEDALLHLARRHRLTVYDAAYLELARRERLPIATLDRALAQAARAEGIAVLA